MREPPVDESPADLSGAADAGRLLSPDNVAPASHAPDFDGTWKLALQTWLPECMAWFWPDIHANIDWTVAPIFLDKELRRLHRIIKKGSQRVDLLVRLQLKRGGKALLLLHLEVQAGRITVVFAKRMFRYRIHLYERYPDHTILSCAILLDRDTGPDTETFQSGDFGDELIFRFPVVNLARWRHDMAKLAELARTNPFAVVVMAQLECRATRPDETRLASKLRLAHALERWGYDADARRALFLVMDSLLTLPEPLEDRFYDALEQTTGDPVMMQQLNSLQRVRLRREKAASLEEGKLEGRLEGAAGLLQTQLEQKFGALPDWAALRLAEADTDTLWRWGLNVLNAGRLEDVFGG